MLPIFTEKTEAVKRASTSSHLPNLFTEFQLGMSNPPCHLFWGKNCICSLWMLNPEVVLKMLSPLPDWRMWLQQFSSPLPHHFVSFSWIIFIRIKTRSCFLLNSSLLILSWTHAIKTLILSVKIILENVNKELPIAKCRGQYSVCILHKPSKAFGKADDCPPWKLLQDDTLVFLLPHSLPHLSLFFCFLHHPKTLSVFLS